MSTATQVASAPSRLEFNRIKAVYAMVMALYADLVAYGEVLVETSIMAAEELNPINQDPAASKSHNIIAASVTLGLSVIMLILMAIVAGYFVAEAPSDGAFSDAISQVESVGGTAFILLAVALLAVPVVAIVGYFINSGLGMFITGGGGMR